MPDCLCGQQHYTFNVESNDRFQLKTKQLLNCLVSSINKENEVLEEIIKKMKLKMKKMTVKLKEWKKMTNQKMRESMLKI